MDILKRMIDLLTHGTDRPGRRLVAYYLILGAIVWPLMYLFPVVDRSLGGDSFDARASSQDFEGSGSQVLVDALNTNTIRGLDAELNPRVELALSTLIILLGVIALMLPVSWVYMTTRYNKGPDQQVAQILIFLPLVVAGIVLVVQHSLALAFSLAGVVAAVRFRSTLRDARDLVFIFLAIAMGFAAGVQAMILGAIVSILFNFVLLLSWRYDFGRAVLAPSSDMKWSEPLRELAKEGENGNVPDRDLVIALNQKAAKNLSERFDRVAKLVGPPKKKARYNAVVIVVTDKVPEAQKKVGDVLESMARRWRLDEVVNNVGKPSELSYLVRIPKSVSKDQLLTEVVGKAGADIISADVRLAEDAQVDAG
jgi:hypothetical protein